MGFFLYVFSIIFIFVIILKIYLKLFPRWNGSATCLIGKTAMVTGANTGIGYYTARDFATRGARVILACRNKERAENAKDRIIRETGNTNVVIGIVDFKSLPSVRRFAKHIKETEDRLDILVNNAGAGCLKNEKTNDGLNLLMQVNYFGPTLLTLLLIDLIKKSTPSRIVNVSSTAAKFAKLDLNDLNAFPNFSSETISHTINYANSKIGNILFTNELARKLKGTGVTVNSLHPGVVNTEVFRHIPPIAKPIFLTVAHLFFLSAELGAQTSIYAAVSKDIEGVTGEYYENCGIPWLTPMPELARDQEFARKFWDETIKVLELTEEEKQLLYK